MRALAVRNEFLLCPAVQTESDNLHDKLREWLNSEGYPLEFATANTFRRCGFATRQGSYVRDQESENPREIDVTASIHASDGDSLIRIYHVIECKWSQDKPWIVFTSDHGMGICRVRDSNGRFATRIGNSMEGSWARIASQTETFLRLPNGRDLVEGKRFQRATTTSITRCAP